MAAHDEKDVNQPEAGPASESEARRARNEARVGKIKQIPLPLIAAVVLLGLIALAFAVGGNFTGALAAGAASAGLLAGSAIALVLAVFICLTVAISPMYYPRYSEIPAPWYVWVMAGAAVVAALLMIASWRYFAGRYTRDPADGEGTSNG